MAGPPQDATSPPTPSRRRRSTRSAAASTRPGGSRSAAATRSSWPASSAPPHTSTRPTTSAPAPASTLTPCASHGVDFEVLFASKAAPITAICEILREEGLSIDVASAGELHIALKAGFDPERIYLHGNNKSPEELQLAFDRGIGTVVVDSLDEIELADSLLDRPQDVLIRLTPGIRPSTHSYRPDRPARLEVRLRARRRAGDGGRRGDPRPPGTCASPACTPTSARRSSSSSPTSGRSRRSPSSAPSIEPQRAQRRRRPRDRLPRRRRAAVDRRVRDVKVEGIRRLFDPLPKILLEPGRSLVGNAGVTLYTVGTVKEIPGVRTYVAVDGGMSDNLRPMLYGLRYEALIADRAAAPPDRRATIAGKHCESGDVLIEESLLADPAARRRPRDAGDRRLRLRDGQQLQRRAAPAGDLLLRRRRPRRRPPRDPRRPDRPRCLSARPRRPARPRHRRRRLRRLLEERAERGRGRLGTAARDQRGAAPQRGRLRRDPRRVRPDRRADGRARAGPRARPRRPARRQAGGHRQQAARRPARRRALRRGARRRGPGPLRGRGRGRGAGDPAPSARGSATVQLERISGIVNGTTNFILSEMAAHRRLLRGGARPRAGARLRRGRPDRGRQRRRRRGEDGDPRPARLPHPGRPRRRLLRGHHRRSAPTTSPTPATSGSR